MSKGRKSDKQRKTINVRFDIDPKVARDQRRLIDDAVKKSGKSRNDFVLGVLLPASRRVVGRKR